MKHFFLSYCMLGFFGHRFQISELKSPIVHFWDTPYKTDRSKFGFYDASGHVFTKKENASFVKLFNHKIPNLNYIHQYSDSFLLFQYEKKNADLKHTCLLDTRTKMILDFDWKNTSATEFIHDDNNMYYRFDYFGNVFQYSIDTGESFYKSLGFSSYEYLVTMKKKNSLLYVLNNMNIFRIYQLHQDGDLSCVYQNKIIERVLTKKMEISVVDKDHTHLIFMYMNDRIDIFTYDGKFNIKSISQIKKEGNAPIIDIAIQNDFLVLTTFRKVILYRYTGVFFEKIQEKVYKDLPNHSEILWKDRVLYFNNQDHLYTIQLDTSRYNQTYSVIKI